jgi:hypothetical protein
VDVDPVSGTFTVFKSGLAGPDGLALSSDGSTLYVSLAGTGHIAGFNTTTGLQVFDSGPITIPNVDGIALGGGTLFGNIFANTNNGTVVEVNLATLAQTVIASGGSRGDFATVDTSGGPLTGTLLLTQTDVIDRLFAGPGGTFNGLPPVAPVPEPGTLFIMGLGLAGLVCARRLTQGVWV